MGSPPVLILMASYNGADWIAAQLRSIAAQDYPNWALWVSDDGSRDATRQIVAEFAAARAGKNPVQLVEGPRAGSAGANFLNLLARPDLPLTPKTLVAFADQDDLWYPMKLRRGVEVLAHAKGAALYGAQSRHIDALGRPTGGRSRHPATTGPAAAPGCYPSPSLGNLLVQNLVSGHSAMLNPLGLRLARAQGWDPALPFHDWWLAQLIAASGGELLIDRSTMLDYRQHGGNTLGEPLGLGAFGQRLGLLRRRHYAQWIRANLSALARADLTPEARALIGEMQSLPEAGLGRLLGFRRLGLHRQSRAGSYALWASALLGAA